MTKLKNRYGAEVEAYKSFGSVPDSMATELLGILIEGEHMNWDGWSDEEKVVIDKFVEDVLIGLSC